MNYVNHTPTTWTSIPTGERAMVVWDAGIETPVSSTLWDAGATNWIG